MYFSVQLDLPTGATIVCTFGIVLALMAAVRPLLLRRTIQNAKFKMQTVPVSETKG
jgi:hypothetical protein